MELLNKYLQEINEDVKYDQINILEKQLMLPATKHKWIARLIQHKLNKNNLEDKKKKLYEEAFESIKNNVPSGIPAASLKKKIDSTEVIQKIDKEIQDCELIIQYLEKVEKILSSITYDIANATKLMVLETT
ncbi:MAG: hypothetical protein EBQ92_00785 [Proteobacteria bacterium]|nr:hypothetical protein [Pseudomonadota bacterium]